MISDKMLCLVNNSSAIRAMFETGKQMALEFGEENVYDFSLGNPSVEPPKEIKNAIINILNYENQTLIHGYMNNSGYEDVRKKIADDINKKFDTAFNIENIIMTAGAAGGLNVLLKTLLNPGDEVITFAPYFGEYRSYTANFEGVLVVVPPDTENFQPDLIQFEEKITKRTKGVIINTPNNPTGVVYSEDTIRKIAEILEQKQKEYGTSIYLISDEPYRELVYEGIQVPYLTKYYKNTLVGYSFSKSLSLPGERIGYLVIPSEADASKQIISAANVANRILGFVNAPSLMQKVVAECIGITSDIEQYKKNRNLLYESLLEYGYSCVRPDGAFYLFVKSPAEDESEFVEAAKKRHILLVPGSSFACSGYVRIAYCVPYERIQKALPGFLELSREFGLKSR